MALPAPITISQQASAMRDWLNQWAQPRGGIAKVVSNLRDMWSQATQASDKPTILICFNGSTSRGSVEVANALHREDREWIVAVIRGRGFNAKRGDSLTDARQNAEPFYDSLETVRDLCRRMLGISEEQPTIDYKGIRPIQLGTMTLDGYYIVFTTANDIPAILTTPPVPPE